MTAVEFSAPEPAHAIGKSHWFWYRRSVAGGNEFVLVNGETGDKSPAFDAARIADALSRATGGRYTPRKLPFNAIEFNEDRSELQFVAADSRWKVNLATYTCDKLPLRRGDPQPLRSLPGPSVAEATGAVVSPDGKWRATIRNFNVWVQAMGTPVAPAAPDQRSVPPAPNAPAARALSFDGSEGNYYALSDAAWSPDAKKLAVYRVRPGHRRKIGYIESSPADQVQPKFSLVEYAKPGDALDLPQALLLDVATRQVTPVDTALYANPYSVTGFQWRKDSRAFSFEYNQRGHQVYRVIEVNAETGQPRAVIDERSPTFYCYYSKHYRHDVNDGREVIWMSERDGWNHLYLYDGATGKPRNQITRGPWVVRTVAKVDDPKRQIWFAASGMHAGKDPYFLHWFRINFDGTGLTPLTRADAHHDLAFTDDLAYYIDTYSRVDRAPVAELHRASDGTKVATLEQPNMTALMAAGWRAPEVFTAPGRDGQTPIWGLIYRPSNFDAAKKYPVLEYIYAGPHSSFVPKTFSAAHAMQAMAELGFIVVQMDGMGTSNRSKAFHDVCWKNIGDAGFPDRILWHQAAAAKYAWYDLARLGIYGHSAGGQNSLGALLFHGDFYKAAASSAGCHDNRMDKISWNEQWMSWPVGPEYAASSNVEHAARLKGRLLLAVGELDTNVDPASTMQVVNALIQAGKTFDLLLLPGRNHGAWGDYWERKRDDFFVRELLGVQPPDWNVVTPVVSATL